MTGLAPVRSVRALLIVPIRAERMFCPSSSPAYVHYGMHPLCAGRVWLWTPFCSRSSLRSASDILSSCFRTAAERVGAGANPPHHGDAIALAGECRGTRCAMLPCEPARVCSIKLARLLLTCGADLPMSVVNCCLIFVEGSTDKAVRASFAASLGATTAAVECARGIVSPGGRVASGFGGAAWLQAQRLEAPSPGEPTPGRAESGPGTVGAQGRGREAQGLACRRRARCEAAR